MEELKVSVFILTYNQAQFIRQCLDGVVCQKTNFNFDVIIHDDCSTDGTKEIIEEYAAKYSFIKPIYETENQFQKGKIAEVIKNTYKACNGEYVALLEGDDYWCDVDKLQIQVDFLDKNPDFTGCFHKSLRKNVITGEDIKFMPENPDRDVFDIDYVKSNSYFIETVSSMYRFKKYKEDFLENFPENIINGDAVIIYYFALHGKIKYIDRLMSVKTINEGGIWNSVHLTVDEKYLKYWQETINLSLAFKKMFKKTGKPYENDARCPENSMKIILNSALNLKRYDIIQNCSEKYPEIFRQVINPAPANTDYLHKKIKKYKKLTKIFASLTIFSGIILLWLSFLIYIK